METLKKKILLVDDEIAFLYPVKKMMQKRSVDIDISDNLAQAIKLLKSNDYDALILDVRLTGTPDSEGLFILEVAKAISPSTKVLVMTGFGDPNIMKRALAGGADCYFEKPVAFSTMTDALQGLGVL